MTVVLIEGWDHFAASQTQLKGWSSTPSAAFVAGRFGGQALKLANAGGQDQLRKPLPSSYSTVFWGLAFQGPNDVQSLSSANNGPFQLQNAGTQIANLSLDGSNRLQVRNSSNALIATGTTVIAPGAWYYAEIKLVVGTSGTCEVHLNGAVEIASTVGNFGTTNITQIFIQQTASNRFIYVDDIYVADTTGAAPRNTFLGDVRVKSIYPSGAGAHTAWTPDSGSNYARVNETLADGDTSYVSSANPGDIDTYAYDDIDTLATVFALQTNHFARKDDAAVRQIAPVVRQAGTDYVGNTLTLGSSYLFYEQIYQQDPTSADWTAANVNANEFGHKEIA